MAEQRFTPEPTPFKEKHMKLYGPNGSGKSGTLVFHVVNNMPRITVYTNDDNDSQKDKPIEAKMDQPTFFAVLEMIKKTATSKDPCLFTMENKGHTFFGGNRSERPEVISRLIVGKDEEGMIYISVEAKGRPKLKFPFLPGQWHEIKMVGANDQPITKAQLSILVAGAWVNMLTQMVGNYLITNFKDIKPEDKKGGQQKQGGYGGSNKWSNDNRSDNRQRPQADNFGEDEDLPF